MPRSFSDTDPAEDPKLMYVALTRPEDYLFITHSEPSSFIDRIRQSGKVVAYRVVLGNDKAASSSSGPSRVEGSRPRWAMKHGWLIEPDDVKKVKALLARHEDNPFVKKRVKRNLRADKPKVEKEAFWQQMVCCLLTTHQRSDPDAPVGRFIGAEPFGLGYAVCWGKKTCGGTRISC
jgi:hypothetical protein